MSIAEKLKLKQIGAAAKSYNISSPISSQPSSPKIYQRQATVPRCGLCAGCLRTEKCNNCSSCVKKSGQCVKKRCVEKVRETARRQRERKSLGIGYAIKSASDSSDIECISATNSPVSNSPVNQEPCNECVGCIRTEDCGVCVKCTSGKK